MRIILLIWNYGNIFYLFDLHYKIEIMELDFF